MILNGVAQADGHLLCPIRCTGTDNGLHGGVLSQLRHVVGNVCRILILKRQLQLHTTVHALLGIGNILQCPLRRLLPPCLVVALQKHGYLVSMRHHFRLRRTVVLVATREHSHRGHCPHPIFQYMLHTSYFLHLTSHLSLLTASSLYFAYCCCQAAAVVIPRLLDSISMFGSKCESTTMSVAC